MTSLADSTPRTPTASPSPIHANGVATDHRVTFHQTVPQPTDVALGVELAAYRPTSPIPPTSTPGPTATGGKSQPITAYNGPKDALLAIVKAGMAKSILPTWQTVLLGFNAGLFLAFGNLAATVIAGGLTAPSKGYDAAGALVVSYPANPILAKMAHGLIFPLGLVLIVLAGSELFTGNTMYMSVAWAAGKIRGRVVVRNLLIVWFSNFAGAIFVAFFLCYLPQLVHFAPQSTYLAKLAIHKMDDGWGSMFLKGVGCNWMVCLALYLNLTCQDVISKIFALWFPITTFVFIGWEHSIANMFLIPAALMEGVTGDHHTGQMFAWNLIPVTLGNLLGGFLFAMGQYSAYGEYAVPKIQVLTTKHVEAAAIANKNK